MKPWFSLLLLVTAFTACAQPKTDKKLATMNNEPIPNGVKTDTATFGEGCFWCTEAFFKELRACIK